jgi:hypothetical protein
VRSSGLTAAWLKFAAADLREKGDPNRWWVQRTDGLFALDLKTGAMRRLFH